MPDLQNLDVKFASGASVTNGGTLYSSGAASSAETLSFNVDFSSVGLTYASATDVVYLEVQQKDLDVYERRPLTASGTLFTYTHNSTHFGVAGIQPGTSLNYEAWIVVERNSSGTYTRSRSRKFTLTIDRGPEFTGINPTGVLSSATVLGAYSAWDLVGLTSGTGTVGDSTVSTTGMPWQDRSGFSKDLFQSTSNLRPIFYRDRSTYGRPHVRFDGSDDVMSSTFTFAAPISVVGIFRIRALSATRELLRISTGTNPVILSVTTSNVNATCGGGSVDVAHTIQAGQWFCAGITCASGSSVNAGYNGTIGTAAGSSATGSAGVLRLGYDGTNYTNMDVAALVVFNKVLTTGSSGEFDFVMDQMMQSWGVS